MADILDRVLAGVVEKRFTVDTWITDYLIPSFFQYGNTTYPVGLSQTLQGTKAQEYSATLPGYMNALMASPPAFAAQLVRGLVISGMRFTFRNKPWHPTKPRKVFGTSELARLETPWPGATTQELAGRMEWHEGLAGNSYVVRRPDRLKVLRPDWTILVHGSELEPEEPMGAIDQELVGYIYINGGINSGNKPVSLLPNQVAHWAPLPDPLSPGLGMSWITPAIRDIQGDQLMTQHKILFFQNGATPNLVVKGIEAKNRDLFREIVEEMEEQHAGLANAYRTLYLTKGADASVVGADLKAIDWKATMGTGETRLSMLSRVHPVILGSAEGLQGSALNAGNFGMARRIWADTWIYPMLQDLASTMSTIMTVPRDAEMWFDAQDMPILREDGKDEAEILQVQANIIAALVKEGFTAKSAMAAVMGKDMNLLEHTGLVSVQLQPPGTQITPSGNGATPDTQEQPAA